MIVAASIGFIVIGFALGVLATVVVNRTRWAIFPLTGGPFRWIGGPPGGDSPALRDEEVERLFDPRFDPPRAPPPGQGSIARVCARCRKVFTVALPSPLYDCPNDAVRCPACAED